VRFAVARQEGLSEERVALIDDGYASSELPQRQKAAVAFADAFLSMDGPPSEEQQAALVAEFGADGVVELGVGMALFHGFSKLLIAIGAEPEQMATTILPTPGS
jgi:alkylhydroperoxidase family enzyme